MQYKIPVDQFSNDDQTLDLLIEMAKPLAYSLIESYTPFPSSVLTVASTLKVREQDLSGKVAGSAFIAPFDFIHLYEAGLSKCM
jgi:hypothetical protein